MLIKFLLHVYNRIKRSHIVIWQVNKMKKKLVMTYSALFALSVGIIGVSAASVGGGTWNYGVG